MSSEPPTEPSIDAQRRARTAEWKANPAAFRSYLLDSLYDHLQIADELARSPDLEPKDRLKALTDFSRSAREAIEAVQGEEHVPSKEDEPLDSRAQRKRGRGKGGASRDPQEAPPEMEE